MVDLVKTDGKKAFTNTLLIADGVGTEHRAVMQLLKTHSKTKTLSTFEMLKVSRGGRPVEYAELNERQATFLVTLMKNSDKVVEFKELLTNEFITMRSRLAELASRQRDKDWLNTRKDGKVVYMQKTDVIKKFVEYATTQGSGSAKRYYTALAKMENSALFFFEQKYKNMREVLTIKQLMQVATADDVIEKALEEGMKEKLDYHDIYKLAKSRIVAFAGIIGQSPVLGLSHKKD